MQTTTDGARIGWLIIVWVLALAGCSSPPPASPRPTAPAILDITPAPTQNIDATATAYAARLVPTPTPSGLYVVQPNDTLSGLAEDFGTTVEELMAANNLTDPNAIQAGQTLIIPALITNTLDLATASALPSGTAVTTPTLAAATPVPGTPTPASP
jgi:LysM repeat protein